MTQVSRSTRCSHGSSATASPAAKTHSRCAAAVTGRLRSTASSSNQAKYANGSVPDLPNGHLVEGQQAICWLDHQVGRRHAAPLTRNSSIKRGKLTILELLLQAQAAKARSKPAGPSRAWMAVGTASGAVKAYDSASGELQWQCRDSNEG